MLLGYQEQFSKLTFYALSTTLNTTLLPASQLYRTLCMCVVHKHTHFGV